MPENKNSAKETWSMKTEFSLSFGDYSININLALNKKLINSDKLVSGT